ncbi:hypothetical protein [Sorangium sp. So ce1024]|jgi:hypothetical protein|uniref:hypothetical protein n=1 Tax=unclassified Sorangium TaxID=2621164 RepID=UPI003F00D6B0
MNRVIALSCLSTLTLSVGLLLSACTVTTTGSEKPGDAEGPEASDLEESDADDCSAMKDESPVEPGSDGAVVTIVLTNERDVPVYYPSWDNAAWYSCPNGSWRVDDASIAGHSPPACEGLLQGEPGLPSCVTGYERLDAGETVEFAWDRRVVGTVPVIQECVDTADGPFETCSRAHLVEDGPHELSVEIGLDLDENSGFPTSYLPAIVVPLTLPTDTVNVVVAP